MTDIGGYEKRVANALRKLPENHLTKSVIIPLFESLGYFKVEFFGGPSEEGKDIICWDYDRLGDLRLTVAQVKHFKFTNKASHNNSLQTIVNQLITCLTKPILFTNGSIHLPSEVFLISTFDIDTKSLQTRFSTFPNLIDQKIKIIDGTKLSYLIISKRPDILKYLIGPEIDISLKTQPVLNNQILLTALGYGKKKEIKDIYTDIDLSLGKRITELFFKSSFNPTTLTLNLKKEAWEEFKSLCEKLSIEFALIFIKEDFNTVETLYKVTLHEYNRWKEKIDLLNSLIITEKKNSGLIQTKKLQELKTSLSILEEQEPHLYYQITLNGSTLINMLEEKRKWIESQIDKFNRSKPNLNVLATFIIRCQIITDLTSIIFRYPNYFHCIGFDTKSKFRNDLQSTRFKISIEEIFDTGLNLIVLGEAGAGKTTSLQMYFLNRLHTNKLIIYASLAMVVQNWVKTNPYLKEEQRENQFDEAITCYLVQIGVLISPSEFRSELESKKVVLLLDGFDEAITSNSWLPKAIKYLSIRYISNLQIIVTSRFSGEYLDKIPFFTITLLPFTDSQRNTFIGKWFEFGDYTIIEKITNHLEENAGINEIVKNPLLTTILCILAENNLPLPNTEIKLYNERLRLLSGYYDHIKNIARISSTPTILESLSQKLAFNLHFRGIREEEIDSLKHKAISLMNENYAEKDILKAFNELIDPCNILVYMTEDGKIGFGHLRFQEHLAAKELITNRSIDLIPLLKDPWWRSVLIIFAQLSDSLLWFANTLAIQSETTQIAETFAEMVKTRPEIEQKKIKHALRFHSYLPQ